VIAPDAGAATAVLDEALPAIQALIDSLPFYVLLVDEDHGIVAANTAVERELANVAPPGLVGRSCPATVHSRGGGLPECPLEEALERASFVTREVREESSGRWFLSSIAPTRLRTRAGKVVCFHFAQDITAQKEDARLLGLRQEHDRAISAVLQQVQACLSAPLILEAIIDQILSFSWVGLGSSAAGFLVEGRELGMVARRNLDPEVQKSCAVVPLGKCLCGVAAESGRTIVSHQVNGGHQITRPGMPDHGHLVVPVKHAGRVLAVLNFYLPPKERKLEQSRVEMVENLAAISAAALHRLQMQAQLAQSDRLASLGFLASIISHEVRTPLNVLSINAQSLERKLRRQPSLEEHDRDGMLALVAGLRTEIQRMNHRIDELLLTVVRRQGPELRAVSVNEVVIDAAQFMEPEARERGVALELELAEALPAAQASVGKLRRVLLNIIQNAIQATPSGGRVALSTALVEGRVSLAVQDTGPGLPPELAGKDAKRVFQPFVSYRRDGTGLGLAICARLVEEMMGSIGVESQPGHGARFEVQLQPVKPGGGEDDQ
jgi:signal transduction histidine kinase